jgi:hypothetical protein
MLSILQCGVLGMTNKIAMNKKCNQPARLVVTAGHLSKKTDRNCRVYDIPSGCKEGGERCRKLKSAWYL